MSVKWDYDATASLLRFGRKNGGPWEDGSVPDDYDTEMVISAPQVAADYAALLARHNALREAVAWERECCQDIRPLVAWSDLYARHGEDYVDAIAEELREIQDAARAEVDRLIASETSADCKGE